MKKLRKSLINTVMKKYYRSRDSSVGIAKARAGSPGFHSPQVQDFSLLDTVQTGSGLHPTSYLMGTECCFPAGKSAGA
jgi:hypothetical protein